jgi:hypothetical protein
MTNPEQEAQIGCRIHRDEDSRATNDSGHRHFGR